MFETILLLIGGLLAMNVAIVWFARRAVRTPLPPSEPRDGALFAIEGTLAGCSRELEAPLSFTRCAAFELSQNDGTRAWRCAEQLDVRLDTGDVVSLALPEAVHAELGRRRTGRLPGGVRFETRRGRAAAAADDATEVIDGRRITTERSLRIGDTVHIEGKFTRVAAGLEDPMRRDRDAPRSVAERDRWVGHEECFIADARHREFGQFGRVARRTACARWSWFGMWNSAYAAFAVYGLSTGAFVDDPAGPPAWLLAAASTLEVIMLPWGIFVAVNVYLLWLEQVFVPTVRPPARPRDGAPFAIEGMLVSCAQELEAPLSGRRCAAFRLAQGRRSVMTALWRSTERIDVRLDSGDVVSLALPSGVFGELGRRRSGRLADGVRFDADPRLSTPAGSRARPVIDGGAPATEFVLCVGDPIYVEGDFRRVRADHGEQGGTLAESQDRASALWGGADRAFVADVRYRGFEPLGRLFWRGAARSWGVFAFANGVTGAVVALLRFA